LADRSVIIIGAGLAGLAAGVYCQMQGYDTRIFEHHNKPGGVAATWKRKDYTIEGGIHFVMGYKPGDATYQLYRDLGIDPGASIVDMTDYGRFIDEATGRVVSITKDLTSLVDGLNPQHPGDARLIGDLVKGSKAMAHCDLGLMGLAKPPELMGRLGRVKEMWEMRRVLKYMGGKYARPVEEYAQEIADPFARQVIRNLFLPEVPVWFVLMVLGLIAGGKLGLLTQGSLAFARAIATRYQELGGEVTYRATVQEILVDKDQAVGVRLADGREYRAGTVVSAADGHSTIFGMLGGRYTSAKIRERYAAWPLVHPFMMLSFGVAREFPGEPHFITIIPGRPIYINQKRVPGMLIRIFNYTPAFAPQGKSVVQVEIETEWDYWAGLREESPSRYQAEKKRLAAAVLDRLEAHYPGISGQVEVTDVATPYTTWRYTRNHRGAWEGWLPTPRALMTPIERTLPGLQHFYMAGQWVMPGGGVIPCLYSGRHVAQLLCRRDGKQFGVRGGILSI